MTSGPLSTPQPSATGRGDTDGSGEVDSFDHVLDPAADMDSRESSDDPAAHASVLPHTDSDSDSDEPTGDLDEIDAEFEEPRGSRLDEWWARMLRTPRRLALWYWGGPIAVTLLAAVLRLWDLGNPHSLVFDETFYVKDGWTIIHNGVETTWPADADTQFNAGNTDIYNDEGEYVVHPPLGKWLIGLGMIVFGADNAFGWRIATALVGILAVFLVTIIARRLFRSTIIAVIAGFLLAIEGHAIVLSRVSLLDNFVMIFGLLGFGAILLDRTWSESRLAMLIARRAERRGSDDAPDWGPIVWWRPWLIAAGLMFGLMSGVKWSGIYMLAAFGIYVIVVDMAARRRAGVQFWASAAVLKQGPASFLLMVPIAIAAYVACWTGWFVTAAGYYRQWADDPDNAWTGALAWVPHSIQSLWHYHAEAYGWNINLHATHPYQSNPLGWLFLLRPTNMYYLGTDSSSGCSVSQCVDQITSIPNPIIWWAGVAAMFYLIYRLVRFRDWRVGLILMGMVGGYAPWLLYTGRTVFEFYTIAFEPYLILCLVYVLWLILGSRNDVWWRRQRGIGVVAAFLVVAALVSVFFWPIWTGERIPLWYWQLHIWLKGWS